MRAAGRRKFARAGNARPAFLRTAGLGTILTVAATLLSSHAPVSAATTQYDPSFAAGYEQLDFRGDRDEAAGIKAGPSGTFIVGATSHDPISLRTDAAFVRLTSIGAIDGTFGTAGNGHRVFVSLPSVASPASADLLDFAIAPGGKIVGLAEGGFPTKEYVFRLNVDGSPDTASDADPGTFFGTNGVVTITPTPGNFLDVFRQVAVLPNGGVVVGGEIQTTSLTTREVRAKGFTAKGDFAFDTGLSLGTGSSQYDGMAVSADGSRVALAMTSVSAASRHELGLLVLDAASGDPDLTFADTGEVVIASASAGIEPGGVTFTSAGKLVVAAIETASNAFVDNLVVRFNTDGTLDRGFSSDGLAHLAAPAFQWLESIFSLSGGRTTILGQGPGNGGDITALAVTASGLADTGFDGDGVLRLLPPQNISFSLAAPASNGRMVVVGTASPRSGPSEDVGVQMLKANGQGDGSFGNVVYRDYAFSDQADHGNAIALTPDGGTIVAGDATAAGSTAPELMKLLSTGDRDPAFGHNGLVAVGLSFTDAVARAVAMHGSKPVFAGCDACSGGSSTFLVGQVTSGGAPDTGFSGDGLASTAFGASDAEANGVAVQSNGRVVAVGRSGNDFAIARYRTTGALDTSFGGGDGKVTTDIASGSVDEAFDVAIQADGKIVVVGTRETATDQRFAIVRYTATGALDTTFGGGDGIVVTRVGPISSEARGVAIRSDGRIIVAGFDQASGGGQSIALVRLKSNGVLDTSFSGDGKVESHLTSNGAKALDVAAVGNTIVVVGSGGQNERQLVARYLNSGALDSSFSANGFENPTFDSLAATGLAIQSNGRIVVVGETISATTGRDVIVSRYLP